MTPEPVPRREIGRRTRRRDDMRDELLALMGNFLESGGDFSDLTVEQLTREAGISRTQFYVYFEDKGDLLHSLYLRTVADSVGTIDEWWNDSDIDRARLRRVIGRFVRERARHIMVVRAVNDSVASDAVARRAIESVRQRMSDRFTSVIEAGQQSGAVDSSLDAPGTASLLEGLLVRGVEQLVDRKSTRLNSSH